MKERWSAKWCTITNCFVGTLPRVRVDMGPTHSWVIVQERVLSPLLFYLFRDQLGCGHPSLLSRCPLASLLKFQDRVPVVC